MACEGREGRTAREGAKGAKGANRTKGAKGAKVRSVRRFEAREARPRPTILLNGPPVHIRRLRHTVTFVTWVLSCPSALKGPCHPHPIRDLKQGQVNPRLACPSCEC